MNPWLERIDRALCHWMEMHGHRYLRYSLAFIFLWFGILKPFGISSANPLVAETIWWLPPELAVTIVGLWEVAIGICLLHRPWLRAGLLLMAGQMLGTFLPLILLPEVTWQAFPYALTMEGQYIAKNVVLIAAAIVIGGTVRHRHKHIQE